MYQWSRSAPGEKLSCVFFLHFVYITKSVFSLTSYHIFVHFNHYAAFYSDNKLCAQRFIEFTVKTESERTIEIKEEFIYIMN